MVNPPNRRHELVEGQEELIYLVGLFDEKDASGRWRLYLSPRLDCYAEFDDRDVRGHRPVTGGGVVPGFDSTCVVLRRGAKVKFTWSETLDADDQFDLDARMCAGRSGPQLMSAMYQPGSCIRTGTCTSDRTI